MTDSNLQNTVPEGAFGIGSKKTDDFTKNEKLRNFGIKDIPKALYEQLKKNSGAIVLPNQITEEVIQKAAKTQDEFLKPRSEEEETFFRATAAGIVDIPNEIKHISDYLQGNPYDPNELIDLKALGLEKEGDMDNAAYQIFKFGSGFLIPYAGFNKALKGIKGIKALQGIKNYDKIATGARWFTAGGAADFVGVDAYDENLFNFLADIESPVVNNRFVRPIVEYLSAPERPEEGDESNFGEAKLKQFLTGTVFGETIGITGLAATKGLPKLKSVLEPYAIRLIDDVTGGPNILNPEQMADRTIQLLKDIKNDPTRLEFAKKQIARLKKATLVGSEEFSDEFTKVLDDLPKFDEIAPKTKVTKKTKTKATDLPLQQSKPNPKIWNDVESITDDTWKATGKVLNRIVIPDDFSVEAASALGYDELLPLVIKIAKKISPNDPEKHMRVIYLGAIKEQKRLAKNVTQYMTDIEQSFMLGEDIPDELLQNWSEDVSRMINLAGPTKKISNETAGTVRVNQLIDAEPKDVARKTVDEEVGAGIGGGEKTADRATKEKFRTTTRDLVEKTKKEITEQKLIPTKEELYEGMQTYIKNNDIEGLLGITRKVLAMQGDSKKISKLVKGFGFGDAVGKTLRVSNELFINNLLSAPETQIINIVGSLFNVALGPLDLAAGSPILDKQMKIRAARELVSMFTTMKDSLTAAGKALWLDKNILDERRMFGTQDAYERYAIRMSGDSLFAKSINLFGHGIRVPSRFMMAGDEFVKQTAFRSFLMGELAEQATKKGLTGTSFKIYVDSNFKEITDIVNTRSFTRGQDTAFPDFVPNENILDSYTRALDYSADRTFTTELGKGFGIHGFGSKFTQDAAKILKSSPLKPLIPFVTTPVNIGKQVLRRTGLPDLGTLTMGMPPKYNLTIGRILKEHNDNLLSEDLATAYRANGEATMGAAIWAYFIGLAAQRNNPEAELALIGGGHHNRWLREGEKRTDELPYSFRLLQKDKDGNIIRGDNGLPNYEYIDIFSRLEPVGGMLMIAGDMEYCNDFVSDEDYKNAAQCHIALLSRNLNNKYMIQNIAQMIDLTSDVNGLRRFYQVPVNYITNLVPYSSLWRSITRARGEEWYDELTKKTFKGRFPKRKTKFRKGDLFPQEERTEDRGDYTEDYEEFEGNDFGSLKLSNNPFKDIDTFSTMIMRNLQDQTSGFSADIEPIRSITTGRIAEYPEGAFFGDYFNPFKYKKEKDNPIDEYLRRIEFKVVPPSDVIPFDNEGNGINLDTNAYNKLTGLIPNIPINFKGRNPVFDTKNGKRFGEMILELSRDKTNIKALKYLESDDSGAIDAQATLKNKDKIRKELQKKVRDIYKVYKEAAIEYYKEFILDPELKKQAENETRRANEDIMRIINPIVND
jgi:hypothetical protein